MERTFSFEARAVVPTTLGFTSATPSAGRARTKADQDHQRHGVAHRREPRRAQRSQQKIGAAQDQIGQRKRAAEAHAVGERSAEDRQKPHQPAEESGERAGLLGGELQDFVQIARQRGEGRVIGKPLEQLADVGDPEGTLEAGANVAPTLRKAQMFSSSSCQ